VRYTEYDETRTKVEKVCQVEYHDPEYFHSQVLEAVSYGLDVSICTRLSIRSLQKKLNYWTK
jgi:bisphosphoglycerate-dependent phosphoglycerate mutase